MKLTEEQTNKILQKLKDNTIRVFNIEDNPFYSGFQVGEEYFNEKVNEALEQE